MADQKAEIIAEIQEVADTTDQETIVVATEEMTGVAIGAEAETTAHEATHTEAQAEEVTETNL